MRYTSDETYITELDVFDENDILDRIAQMLVAAKSTSNIESLPAVSIYLSNAPVKAGRALQYFIDCFNSMSISQSRDEQAQTLYRSATNLSLTAAEWNELPSWAMFNVYIDQVGFTSPTRIKLIQCFKMFVYLPTLLLQTSRRQIVTGINRSTRKPVFSRLQATYPTPRLAARSPMQNVASNLGRASQAEIVSYLMYDFLHCLFHVTLFFNEGDQDMLPSNWSNQLLHQFRTIKRCAVPWVQAIEKVKDQRRYTLARDGVEVKCEGYGDLHSITLKEASKTLMGIPEELFLYAKCSYSDGTEDLWIINLETGFVYGADDYIRGFFMDRLLDAIFTAYFDLTCTKMYKTSTGGMRSNRHSKQGTSSGSERSFIYLPRTSYDLGGSVRTTIRHLTGMPKAPHGVSGHLRKGKPSANAIDAAKKYGISLDPKGFQTFVKPYQTGHGQKVAPTLAVVHNH